MAIASDKDNSFSEIYIKASSFCAYQERTQQEVREKLYALGAGKDEIEEIISKLIIENFINEERFAKAFAGGKFRIKNWGRIKIQYQLEQKGLSGYCIRKGMEEIDEFDYFKTLRNLIMKKKEEEREMNSFKKKNKIALYLIRKGYEPELVWEEIKNSINEKEPK